MLLLIIMPGGNFDCILNLLGFSVFEKSKTTMSKKERFVPMPP
jgi:hypothetical protein